jgi:hypothetical protein
MIAYPKKTSALVLAAVSTLGMDQTDATHPVRAPRPPIPTTTWSNPFAKS